MSRSRPNGCNVSVARIYESQVRYEEAVEAFSTIDPATPHGWLARLSIASNLHALERVDDAAELLRVMANERPDRTDAATTLGDFLRQEEQYTEAVEAYDLAFECDAAAVEQPPIRLVRGAHAFDRQIIGVDRLGILFQLERAVELRPNDPIINDHLGDAYWLTDRNHEASPR